MADKEDDKDAAAVANAANGGISEEAQKIIDDLKVKLEGESARAVEAERRANANAGAANAAVAQVEDANMQLVATAIDTVEATQVALKARYRDALASQDYDAAADIQVEMSTNAAKLIHLQTGKSAMEEEKKNPKRQPDNRQINVADPVEALARTLTPQSAAWVRAHPQYVRNPRLNRQMIRAHEDFIDEIGQDQQDTPTYFKYVEEKLGITSGAGAAGGGGGSGDDAISAAGAGKQRVNGDDSAHTPPPALPAGRIQTGKNALRLTPEQKDAAASSGITEEQYAANLSALKAEGKIH